MKTWLALNTGFAVNRFTLPEQWIPLVKNELGVKYTQFTADMLMPYMLDPLAVKIARRTRAIADDHGLIIDSTFTGAFTRLNHFSHPDQEVRQYWRRWFRAFADISVILGATSMGSHFGIQTIPDYSDPERREWMLESTVQSWRGLAGYAKEAGLAYLTWEPMSIDREYGEKVWEVERIQGLLKDFSIPMLLLPDVDHGDVSSPDPDDTKPYVYLERFATISPLIHLKQSNQNKGGHWPFTPENNARGRILPEKVINALKKGGASEVGLILELSFRERAPAEKRMVSDLKQSIEFWRPYCTD